MHVFRITLILECIYWKFYKFMFKFMCLPSVLVSVFYPSVSSKTSGTKTSTDIVKISEEIFPGLLYKHHARKFPLNFKLTQG